MLKILLTVLFFGIIALQLKKEPHISEISLKVAPELLFRTNQEWSNSLEYFN